jgi:hypothetical protein
MKSARHLYLSLGFIERDEYQGSEILEKMKPFWLFMENEILLSSRIYFCNLNQPYTELVDKNPK